MKSRFLTLSEKKDVARAAMGVLKAQHLNSVIHVTVADETDHRGVPQYTATISTLKDETPPT